MISEKKNRRTNINGSTSCLHTFKVKLLYFSAYRGRKCDFLLFTDSAVAFFCLWESTWRHDPNGNLNPVSPSDLIVASTEEIFGSRLGYATREKWERCKRWSKQYSCESPCCCKTILVKQGKDGGGSRSRRPRDRLVPISAGRAPCSRAGSN